MSGPTHNAFRDGNTIRVYLYDGRRGLSAAFQIGSGLVQPWESWRHTVRENTGAWVFEVDEVRSARRKEVMDELMAECDRTDENFTQGDDDTDDPNPPVEWYLADIATMLARRKEENA